MKIDFPKWQDTSAKLEVEPLTEEIIQNRARDEKKLKWMMCRDLPVWAGELVEAGRVSYKPGDSKFSIHEYDGTWSSYRVPKKLSLTCGPLPESLDKKEDPNRIQQAIDNVSSINMRLRKIETNIDAPVSKDVDGLEGARLTDALRKYDITSIQKKGDNDASINIKLDKNVINDILPKGHVQKMVKIYEG